MIELLVVVTIIVVLLALLMPAMDRAIYQAELAVCSGRLKAGATGVIQYAMDSKRFYPHRQGPKDELVAWGQSLLANRFYNDRPTIFRAVRPELLLDPFSSKLNLETTVPDNYIDANYMLWFDWGYIKDGNRGMRRVGDRFTFDKKSYNLLLSDGDVIDGNEASPPDAIYEASTHPDRAGVMFKRPGFQDVVNPWPGWNTHGAFATWTNWSSQSLHLKRGELDLNFAYDDGSVLRSDGVIRDDPRMAVVPSQQTGTEANLPARRIQVPRQ